ncbi:DUF4112 domain-containing protein [Hoeflea sp.]|uniref:DUF4112 domain-containing protein n=1 Tax=Hoeflea sp. TaxID=1940281 RepID=UPI0025C44BB9|nr:DUF4112 domain-containing protein [Hoeflea sp.]MBU4527792.1 DUF4112 domain-containing protein [Alphaproteobacteria bacterium]MBU4546173.1 DUF4112 domain-containing protein [Alphaproteobacteria bacterium]MBU4553142.1 DUF4112 domain-containing protein [Alphaproteobacteria bacterium]MBV1785100.1 DUF4112 domain-containing protein [Hoeflea sp.]
MSDATPTLDQDSLLIERELAQLDRLAKMLDSRFRLPGTTIRFGFDSIIGLVPGIGDTLMAAPSAWIIWRGHKMGLGKRHLARMIANTGIDYVIGSVPVIGDIFDVGFKANLRNLSILREELGTRKRGQSRMHDKKSRA